MPNVKKVILLGPTEAGKTQLLWAAYHCAQPTGDGLAFNAPDGGAGIRLDAEIGGDRSLESFVREQIVNRGPGGTVRPTEILRPVEFAIAVEDQMYPEGIRADFKMFDPKGGWVAVDPDQEPFTGPQDFAADADLDTSIKEELFNVDAVIYCVPMTRVDRKLDLEMFLSRTNPAALRSITLCVTKFDSIFLGRPLVAADSSGQPRTQLSFAYNARFALEQLSERLAEPDVRDLVDRLSKIANRGPETTTEIKVMPVSSFGFIPGTGQANARAVQGGRAYEMLAAVPEHLAPTSGHYPFEFNQVFKTGAADSLWAPFQAFETFLSVLFDKQSMQRAGICVFDWAELQRQLS